jgi:hypothetical protein
MQEAPHSNPSGEAIGKNGRGFRKHLTDEIAILLHPVDHVALSKVAITSFMMHKISYKKRGIFVGLFSRSSRTEQVRHWFIIALA